MFRTTLLCTILAYLGDHMSQAVLENFEKILTEKLISTYSTVCYVNTEQEGVNRRVHFLTFEI